MCQRQESLVVIREANQAVASEEETVGASRFELKNLVGLGEPSTADRAASELFALQAGRPHPIRVVGTPIGAGAPLWRTYMRRHRQNLPWQYHNGGSWPFVGGFWVLLLAQIGRTREARGELERLALANRVNDWEFNEWFHGLSGEPMGMARQSWNAALFVLAYRALADGTRFFPKN